MPGHQIGLPKICTELINPADPIAYEYPRKPPSAERVPYAQAVSASVAVSPKRFAVVLCVHLQTDDTGIYQGHHDDGA